MSRCPECNGSLQVSRPQVGDQEAVCRCTHCGTLVEMDSQPSAPEDHLARRVWVHAPVFLPTPMWLN